MTTSDRITPADVRDLAENMKLRGLELQERIANAIADQMEADATELKDLTASTELFIKCLERAGRMWREAHPDKPLVWPDGAANIVWLLDERDTLAAKVREYEKEIKRLVSVVEFERGEMDILAAEVAELEERMKGRVLVPVEYQWSQSGKTVHAWTWQTETGVKAPTLDEATVILQRWADEAAIDKEVQG